MINVQLHHVTPVKVLTFLFKTCCCSSSDSKSKERKDELFDLFSLQLFPQLHSSVVLSGNLIMKQ